MATYTYTTEQNARFPHLIDVIVDGHHHDLAQAAYYEGLRTLKGFGRTGFTVHPDNLERVLVDLRRKGHELRRSASHHAG